MNHADYNFEKLAAIKNRFRIQPPRILMEIQIYFNWNAMQII